MQNEPYAHQIKGKKGLQRIINAFGYSKDGLCASYRFEQAFRQLVWLNIVLIILVFVLNFGITTKMILISLSFLSLIVELINTAIEAAVDNTSMEKRELAKRAKDAGSAAQAMMILLLTIIWIMAIWREYGF